MSIIEKLREENNGKLPAHTDLGGYPIFYIVADGGCLCPKCANQEDVDYSDPQDRQWFIVGAEVNWEDNTLHQILDLARDVKPQLGTVCGHLRTVADFL